MSRAPRSRVAERPALPSPAGRFHAWSGRDRDLDTAGAAGYIFYTKEFRLHCVIRIGIDDRDGRPVIGDRHPNPPVAGPVFAGGLPVRKATVIFFLLALRGHSTYFLVRNSNLLGRRRR